MTADPHEEARLAPLPTVAPPAARARVDLRLLRAHRELRLLVAAQALTFGAGTLALVALPLQAWPVSHSSLVVGLLSLAEFVPLLATAFLGGALADELATSCALPALWRYERALRDATPPRAGMPATPEGSSGSTRG